MNIDLDLLSGKVVNQIYMNNDPDELYIEFEDGTILRVGAKYDSPLYAIGQTLEDGEN